MAKFKYYIDIEGIGTKVRYHGISDGMTHECIIPIELYKEFEQKFESLGMSDCFRNVDEYIRCSLSINH